MRYSPVLLCAVALSSCGDDHEDCDSIRAQIKARAAQDQRFIDMGRRDNPCTEPIPVTTTDYHVACEELRKCLDD